MSGYSDVCISSHREFFIAKRRMKRTPFKQHQKCENGDDVDDSSDTSTIMHCSSRRRNKRNCGGSGVLLR